MAIEGTVQWIVNGITLILMIVAAAITINKKNNPAFAVAIMGNMVAYYFTQSPLICMIISVVCIIWASKSKVSEPAEVKKPVKSSKVSEKPHKQITGNIIGLILGIGFVAGPLIGYFGQEASFKDPTTQGILILFAVIGAGMIINNIFKLFEGGESVPIVAKSSSKPVKSESAEDSTNKIRCRFCKKLYSSEYNGCPYCKKR